MSTTTVLNRQQRRFLEHHPDSRPLNSPHYPYRRPPDQPPPGPVQPTVEFTRQDEQGEIDTAEFSSSEDFEEFKREARDLGYIAPHARRLSLTTPEAREWYYQWRRRLAYKGVPRGLSFRVYNSGISIQYCSTADAVLATADHRRFMAFPMRCGNWSCKNCWRDLSEGWLDQLSPCPWRFVLRADQETDTHFPSLRGLWRKGNRDVEDVEYTSIRDNGAIWLFLTGTELTEERVNKVAQRAGYTILAVDPTEREATEFLRVALSKERDPLNCRRKVACSQGLRGLKVSMVSTEDGSDDLIGDEGASGALVPDGGGEREGSSRPPLDSPEPVRYSERFHFPPGLFERWIEQKREQGFEVYETLTGEWRGKWVKEEEPPPRFSMVL